MNNQKQTRLFALILCAVRLVSSAQDPKANFCRRWGHQTTVIDDKLYIDGGYVNYADTFPQDHQDWPNTYNSYHDLNQMTTINNELWPDLNISLNKDPRVVPTVHGGILWGDSVNKRYYVYGGESTKGYPESFKMFSYDILKDTWDNFGPPSSSVPPNIASYGAGIGVSETGQGFYYGGWISNSSMNGWTRSRSMSSDFYRYDYKSNKMTLLNSPDKLGRAEGAMVWIPAGDTGLMVYIGGVVDTYGNGTLVPQPMNKTLIYDPGTNSWFTQTAVGTVPQSRRKFCASVAWAPDRSSYNVYLWGGLSVPPPVVNVTAFNDVYVLSIPSFTWVKVFPGHEGNLTYDYGHYSASCNMVKGMSQLSVIGGTYTAEFGDKCDLASDIWAQHNLWTGGINNQDTNDTFWAIYDPNASSNVVPSIIYNVTGGNKNGGATLRSPKQGYDNAASPGTGLGYLLSKNASIPRRSPTRAITDPTRTNKPDGSTGHSPLSPGAIAGIVIGSVVVLIVVALFWCLMARRVLARRRQRSEVAQTSAHPSMYGAPAAGFTSPYSTQGPFAHSGNYPQYAMPPPSEMDAQHMAKGSAGHTGAPSPTKSPEAISPISERDAALVTELPVSGR